MPASISKLALCYTMESLSADTWGSVKVVLTREVFSFHGTLLNWVLLNVEAGNIEAGVLISGVLLLIPKKVS